MICNYIYIYIYCTLYIMMGIQAIGTTGNRQVMAAMEI